MADRRITRQEYGVLAMAVLMLIFMMLGMYLSYTSETRMAEMSRAIHNYYSVNYVCRPASYPDPCINSPIFDWKGEFNISAIDSPTKLSGFNISKPSR